MKTYKTRRRPDRRVRSHTLISPLAVLSFSLLRLVDLWVRRAPDLKIAGSLKPPPWDSARGGTRPLGDLQHLLQHFRLRVWDHWVISLDNPVLVSMVSVYMFYMLASFFIYKFFLQIKSRMYFRHIFPTADTWDELAEEYGRGGRMEFPLVIKLFVSGFHLLELAWLPGPYAIFVAFLFPMTKQVCCWSPFGKFRN